MNNRILSADEISRILKNHVYKPDFTYALGENFRAVQQPENSGLVFQLERNGAAHALAYATAAERAEISEILRTRRVGDELQRAAQDLLMPDYLRDPEPDPSLEDDSSGLMPDYLKEKKDPLAGTIEALTPENLREEKDPLEGTLEGLTPKNLRDILDPLAGTVGELIPDNLREADDVPAKAKTPVDIMLEEMEEIRKDADKLFAYQGEYINRPMKFKIAGQIQEMASEEVLDKVSASVYKRIKAIDPKPTFKAYCIAHEGESSGKIIGIGKVIKKWTRVAVERLTEILAIGTKIFHLHEMTNEHEGRKPIGEIVGKVLSDIAGKLSSIAIAYIYPNYRDIPLDVASIEANIHLPEKIGPTVKISDVDVEEITGIALGNSQVVSPGFAGATLVASLQEFAEFASHESNRSTWSENKFNKK